MKRGLFTGGSMFVQWERSLTVSCYDRCKIEENIAEAKEEIREAEDKACSFTTSWQ